MALCTTCNSFDLYRIFNSPDIRIAASAGCGLCTLLFDAFKRKESEAAQAAGDLPIILAGSRTIEDELDDPPEFSTHIEPKLRCFFMSPEQGLIRLCDLDISIDNAFGDVPTDLPFEPFSKLHCHSNDPGSVALASMWLSSCLENHDCPTPNLTGPSLSTRFLQVGNASRNPHLVEFPSGVSLQPWVALSYRWGKKEPLLKLKKETEGSLKADVDIGDLDATIRDAVTISRGLGIQYLWIDSLCIFQDQKSDCVDTNDVSGSFLSLRETQFVGISWKANPNQGASEEYRNPPQVYVSHARPDHHDPLIGPCVVQYERALKYVPLIEFGLNIADKPGGRPFWRFDLFTKFKLLPKFLKSPKCDSNYNRYRIWYNIVEDYSGRGVTCQRDRLVAISGIAKMYGMALDGDRYVAWSYSAANLVSPPTLRLMLLSWSWANAPPGYTIRNDWLNNSPRPLATLEDVSFSLMDLNNPFGGVLRAKLTIRGPVYRFSRLYHPPWRSPGSNLSAFERHLSHVVELDYGERANDFSREGRYAALLLMQAWPSFDNRLDALVLQNMPSYKDERSTVLKRPGLLKLSFYSIPTSPSLSEKLELQEKSLDYRLNPEGGFRRSKRIFCEEFFQEYSKSNWPCDSVTIV
ncbi:uncharacterized protein Z519_06204 [Cladophialophora bantiana CBS 173.52]|uniref:Heterokaryon incompatibility domain-containing protein n=1 Tax=Cladophialophora bantiana (strain ATCC 10958 / CBS 173.52 / CDC B-1940 / NIH 8579) TaxID=1442370 RepID=A0A0D2I9Y8_CLAB1|nr:uncharacterized protein Z519_06204 [Cladophialophora bantiana CBS 173.52]KIW93599.1 hypothetical protein Z519_06204 [Cladophialophora bantiana CBS 173.52]